MNNSVFKTDNTGFGGNKFIRFYVINPKHIPLSRIEFVVNNGCEIPPKKIYDTNNFQQDRTLVEINFDSKETAKFRSVNVGRVICYDTQIDESTGDYRQGTSQQYIKWNAKDGAICQCKM